MESILGAEVLFGKDEIAGISKNSIMFEIDNVEGRLNMNHVWRGEFLPRMELYIDNSVRCGIKCTVFFLLLLTVYLLRYFYYTLVRLPL